MEGPEAALLVSHCEVPQDDQHLVPWLAQNGFNVPSLDAATKAKLGEHMSDFKLNRLIRLDSHSDDATNVGDKTPAPVCPRCTAEGGDPIRNGQPLENEPEWFLTTWPTEFVGDVTSLPHKLPHMMSHLQVCSSSHNTVNMTQEEEKKEEGDGSHVVFETDHASHACGCGKTISCSNNTRLYVLPPRFAGLSTRELATHKIVADAKAFLAACGHPRYNVRALRAERRHRRWRNCFKSATRCKCCLGHSREEKEEAQSKCPSSFCFSEEWSPLAELDALIAAVEADAVMIPYASTPGERLRKAIKDSVHWDRFVALMQHVRVNIEEWMFTPAWYKLSPSAIHVLVSERKGIATSEFLLLQSLVAWARHRQYCHKRGGENDVDDIAQVRSLLLHVLPEIDYSRMDEAEIAFLFSSKGLFTEGEQASLLASMYQQSSLNTHSFSTAVEQAAGVAFVSTPISFPSSLSLTSSSSCSSIHSPLEVVIQSTSSAALPSSSSLAAAANDAETMVLGHARPRRPVMTLLQSDARRAWHAIRMRSIRMFWAFLALTDLLMLLTISMIVAGPLVFTGLTLSGIPKRSAAAILLVSPILIFIQLATVLWQRWLASEHEHALKSIISSSSSSSSAPHAPTASSSASSAPPVQRRLSSSSSSSSSSVSSSSNINIINAPALQPPPEARPPSTQDCTVASKGWICVAERNTMLHMFLALHDSFPGTEKERAIAFGCALITLIAFVLAHLIPAVRYFSGPLCRPSVLCSVIALNPHVFYGVLLTAVLGFFARAMYIPRLIRAIIAYFGAQGISVVVILYVREAWYPALPLWTLFLALSPSIGLVVLTPFAAVLWAPYAIAALMATVHFSEPAKLGAHALGTGLVVAGAIAFGEIAGMVLELWWTDRRWWVTRPLRSPRMVIEGMYLPEYSTPKVLDNVIVAKTSYEYPAELYVTEDCRVSS